jgi:hypothetical protein
MVAIWIAKSATIPRHGVQFSIGRYLFNLQFTTEVVFHGIIDSKNFAGIMHMSFLPY